MATLDARNGEAGYPPEIFLKIWAWNEKSSDWTLHSRIDQPHGTSHVASLSFSPHSNNNTLYVGSCGENGSLKIWRLKSKARAAVWIPHASLDFPTSRLRSFSWSIDGTLFSVTFDSRVVLYDSSSVTALNTISCSAIRDSLTSHFIGSRYLLIVGKKKLLLWDLILQSATWSHISETDISYVVPHPAYDTFAVFLNQDSQDKPSTTVQVFGARSSEPQLTQSIPLTLPNATWFGAQDRTRGFKLVALTSAPKVVVLGSDPYIASSRPSSIALGFSTQKPSLFQDIFGPPLDAAGPSTIAESSIQPSGGRGAASHQDPFPHPAYLTPSLSSMFSPVVEAFLTVRDDVSGTTSQKDVEEDNEEAMDVDADDPIDVSKLVSSRLTLSGDQLVSFFKKQSTSPLRTPVRANGAAKLTNGTHSQLEFASRKEDRRTNKGLPLRAPPFPGPLPEVDQHLAQIYFKQDGTKIASKARLES
ncbi:hypothetical protein NMY22_g18118 [Coprinellus aureogranulatus]|nr:hypothetical protein NMY22_g18118 [Coprinellus aureogranulatus]